jgi:hypothetical protein
MLGVGEGVVAHGPDLSLVGVLSLLVPPLVCLHLLLYIVVVVGLSIAITSRRRGLAIQLALASLLHHWEGWFCRLV